MQNFSEAHKKSRWSSGNVWELQVPRFGILRKGWMLRVRFDVSSKLAKQREVKTSSRNVGQLLLESGSDRREWAALNGRVETSQLHGRVREAIRGSVVATCLTLAKSLFDPAFLNVQIRISVGDATSGSMQKQCKNES